MKLEKKIPISRNSAIFPKCYQVPGYSLVIPIPAQFILEIFKRAQFLKSTARLLKTVIKARKHNGSLATRPVKQLVALIVS